MAGAGHERRAGRAVTPPRATLANLALAGGAVAVLLLLLEGALRLAGLGTAEVATRRMVDASWTTLLDCYPSNPRGYFDIDLRDPGNQARYRHLAPHRFDAIARRHPWAVEFRYDKERFRDAEIAPKPAGVKRVVVLGDSFTEGQGVKEADTAVRVLGRRLEALAPGAFDVRNAGRRGLDFPELFHAFETSLAWEPDVLVYALVLNDAVQPPAFRARQAFVNDWILLRQNLPDDEDETPSVFRPRLLDFVAGRIESIRVGRATTQWYLDMWSDRNREGWEQTQQYLREMHRRLRARGARLLVAPWPLFVSLEAGYPFGAVHETIRRFCLTEGIAYQDLLDTFRGQRTSALWVHPVDHHPNEIAQREAGEALAPVVLRLASEP
jgi:lysophospholipase L1-like esterase